jgi:hypothetical protein
MAEAPAAHSLWAMELSHLRLAYLGSARATADADSESSRTQLRWFGMVAVVGFAVPYDGSSVLDLHHDVYLAVYFASVMALFAAYVKSTGLDVRTTLTRHWKLAVCLACCSVSSWCATCSARTPPHGLTVRTSSLS